MYRYRPPHDFLTKEPRNVCDLTDSLAMPCHVFLSFYRLGSPGFFVGRFSYQVFFSRLVSSPLLSTLAWVCLVWFGLAWLARGSGGVSRGQPQARASIPRKLDPFRELWFGVSCLSIYFRVKSQVSKSKSHSINIYLAPASPTIPCVCVSVVHTPSTRLARLRLSF